MDDKVIVTHKGALTTKYGAKGLARIREALAALVAADAKRGFKTAIVYLDDAKTMKRMHAAPLQNVNDCRGAKAAIDGVFKTLKPDYLMILGSWDVVPHQDLKNPAFPAGDDPDPEAWGDLPYACDTEYGRDPARFVGPTRVVGRLPDLTGATEPSHLIALLKTATGWRSRPARDFSAYFALSAAVWKGSTRMSLENIFGNDQSLLLSPPKGPTHSSAALGAGMHFINCHGAAADPRFYGQQGEKYPTALTTKGIGKKISKGSVAAVECCFGGELYDSVTLGLETPICQSYLRQGAYGYLGSTTIAYGPADDNGAADLVCQYFLLHLLSGASLGRAALMARQQFVERTGQMDPIDLKTLAQFCLYGDPSVHPVADPGGAKAPAESDETARFRRAEHRMKLKQTGDFLQETKPTASKPVRGRRIPATAKSALANIAVRGGLSRQQPFAAFAVKGAEAPKGQAKKAASAPSRYYLAIGKPRRTAKKGRVFRVAVVAKALNGRIIDYRIYHER